MAARFILASALILSGGGPVAAQLIGRVASDALGLSFDIPAGWQGGERDGTWGLVSTEVPGTIMVTTHAHTSLAELEHDMMNVSSDDPANRLVLVGEPRHPKPNAVVMDLSGTLEWQPMHLCGIGLVNELGGTGLSIIAISPGTRMEPALLDAAMGVMHSVRFVQPSLPPAVDQWRSLLSGTRLTCLSGHADTPGDGNAVIRALDLCPEGNYHMESATDLIIGDKDAGAVTGTGSRDQGTWEVRSMGPEGVRLVLLPVDGGERSYALEDRAGATFLNGEQWFRTTFGDGEHAPHCGR